MKRKKILFVIESLVAAGAEKSLVTFLSILDKSKFEIDLQLFAYGGEFERYLPSEVNLLPPLAYMRFAQMNIFHQFLTFDVHKILARWKYTFALRKKNIGHRDRARFFWNYVSGCIPQSRVKYDVAVAYAQNIPTLYVVDKVSAKMKLAWINAIYTPEGVNREFYRSYYSQINHIITVSDSSQDEFVKVYPSFKNKTVIIRDMLDANFISLMSSEKQEIPFQYDVPTILTVARLERYSKGYDITLNTCRILVERGVKFKWYVIGKGDYREDMESYIAKHHLDSVFLFLGTTPNPYPYIKNCTIYVQTSRHEGYGLSIAEARILNRPVVTTEFDAVWTQMVQGENGIVVPQDPVAVADAIERLMKDKELYNHIVSYQKQEKKGNTEEIEKFYQLIGVTSLSK